MLQLIAARREAQEQERREQDRMRRERLEANGWATCKQCGVLFPPASDRLWATDGYCSRICFLESGQKDASRATCKHWNAKFVAASQKPWTARGYCSKFCYLKAEHEASASPRARKEKASPTVDTLAVQCPAGHSFNVQRAFSGTLRRCPYCGSKTAIH